MTVLHDTAGSWRRLAVGPTDNTSAHRTPTQALRPIPRAARASFASVTTTLPGLRAGENDLTRVAPGRPRAEGIPIHVAGRVLDVYGRPLSGVLVELWNANRYGRYTHPDDPAREPLDPNFFGFGRTISGADGAYEFLTIRPAPYLARPDIGRWRPAHLHISIRGGSARLVTQFYFADDPYLAIDPAFSLLGEAQARHLVRETTATVDDARHDVRRDIVVGGRNTTMFDPHVQQEA